VDPRALGGPVELVAREARSEGGSGRAGSPRRLVATRRSRPSLACEQATESAMEAGTVQPVSQRQLVDAVRSIRPSFGEWMETAKTMRSTARTARRTTSSPHTSSAVVARRLSPLSRADAAVFGCTVETAQRRPMTAYPMKPGFEPRCGTPTRRCPRKTLGPPHVWVLLDPAVGVAVTDRRSCREGVRVERR
jgi:hypothetical protein